MKTFLQLLVGGFLAFAVPLVHAQTTIRTEPGGTRLLFVDGKDIRKAPGDTRLLFIDENTLRPSPTGKRLLFLDGNDVRPEPGGPRLAFWDGPTLRRTPGGTVLLVVDDNIIRSHAGGQRLLFIDGPALSKAQMTATLYLLKPDVFNPAQSAPSTASAKPAKPENPAPNPPAIPEATSGDAISGEYKIARYSNSNGTTRSGSVSIQKRGPLYALTFKTGDAAEWQGIAFALAPKPGGNIELWAAVGPPDTVALGIYQAREGTLRGAWYPLNGGEDRTVYGSETLVGSPKLGGAYQSSGKLPNGGATYTGALTVEPGGATLNGDGETYLFKWPTGTVGAAFRAGDLVAVCAGWGADCQIVRFRIESGNLAGEFYGRDKSKGSYTLGK